MILGVSVPVLALIGVGLFFWSRSGTEPTAHTAVPTANVVVAAPPKPADAPTVDVRPVEPTELPDVTPKVAADPAYAGNDLIERNAYGAEPVESAEPRVTSRSRFGKTKQQPKQGGGAASTTSTTSSDAPPRPKARPRQDDEDLGI